MPESGAVLDVFRCVGVVCLSEAWRRFELLCSGPLCPEPCGAFLEGQFLGLRSSPPSRSGSS